MTPGAARNRGPASARRRCPRASSGWSRSLGAEGPARPRTWLPIRSAGAGDEFAHPRACSGAPFRVTGADASPAPQIRGRRRDSPEGSDPLVGRAGNSRPNLHSSAAVAAAPPAGPAASAARRCATRSSTSACRRCARASCAAEQLDADGAVLPAPRPGLRRAASWSSCRSTSRRRRSSASTPTSRRTRTAGSSTPGATPRRWIERFGLDADSLVVELASNDGYLLQHFVARGSRCLGIEPAANVAEAAREQGVPTLVEFFGARHRPTSWRAEGAPRRSHRRQQRARPGARPQRLRGRDRRSLLAPRRRRHDRVPAPAAADRGQPVRHDLPRALLVLLAARRPSGSSPRHGLSLRRRGAPDARRLAAHLRPPRRRPAPAGRASASRDLRAREAAAGYRHARGLRARSPSTSRRPSGSLLEFLIEAKRDGKHGRRLRRPGQGQHAAELLRHPHRLLDYTVDRNPYKHGPVPARARTSRSIRPERIAETRPDYILILPWNLKERDRRAARVRPRVGRAVRRPDPARCEVLRMKVVLFCGGLGLRMREASRVASPSRWSRSATGRSCGT